MAYLTLSDGTEYEGIGFGYEGDAVGEVVFNTGMTGYQELLTDPAYLGQIVNMTYPLIGNYGVNHADTESDVIAVRGLVVRDYCAVPSNWQCEDTLDSYLKQNKIVAIHAIDTRALTRKLRNCGTMAGIITQERPTKEQLETLKSYKSEANVMQATCKEAYELIAEGEPRVAILDYGLKRNLLASLRYVGISYRVFPASTTAEEIMEWNPDGVILTNGPGDPKANEFQINEIKKMIGKLPIWGICLGHELLALAYGADTQKLKYGHRGSNHPVRDLMTGKMYITGQNHGYAVVEESVKDFAKVSHINWNDRTVEGLVYNDGLSFSVQFHPEAGPRGTGYLFERFAEMLRSYKGGKN
ncbi:MAG: glutamine-hydrolyzing carbamoyl-phosphate synthase small subunit [Clostridia bacterium]|nr:glutamine-hydrolyzing carbamoyl-phosphate synthase small subunit [Clostridia bacterium]